MKTFSASLSFLARKNSTASLPPASVMQRRHQCIEPVAAVADDAEVCRCVGRSAATKVIIRQTNPTKART